VLANSNHKRGDILHDFAMKAKTLEINPHSPLIEGLLRRIKDLPSDEDEKDEEAEAELKEVTSILIDGALVRSGFDVQNKNQYVFLPCLEEGFPCSHFIVASSTA
jgi:heat shock protein 90kDa beta